MIRRRRELVEEVVVRLYLIWEGSGRREVKRLICYSKAEEVEQRAEIEPSSDIGPNWIVTKSIPISHSTRTETSHSSPLPAQVIWPNCLLQNIVGCCGAATSSGRL